VHTASEMFLRELRKRCDDVGAVLIYDEIQVRGLALGVCISLKVGVVERSVPQR